MISKFLLCAIGVVALMGCSQRSCYRSIEGVIKAGSALSNVKVRVWQYFGPGFGSIYDAADVDSDGKYKLTDLLVDPQKNCDNECQQDNTTLPVTISVEIYKHLTTGDSVLKKVEFSCEKDYALSGNNIQLPWIEMP